MITQLSPKLVEGDFDTIAREVNLHLLRGKKERRQDEVGHKLDRHDTQYYYVQKDAIIKVTVKPAKHNTR